MLAALYKLHRITVFLICSMKLVDDVDYLDGYSSPQKNISLQNPEQFVFLY